jgi:hypothetical protein
MVDPCVLGGLDDGTARGAGGDACPCGCGSCGRTRNVVSLESHVCGGEQGEGAGGGVLRLETFDAEVVSSVTTVMSLHFA